MNTYLKKPIKTFSKQTNMKKCLVTVTKPDMNKATPYGHLHATTIDAIIPHTDEDFAEQTEDVLFQAVDDMFFATDEWMQ